MEHEWRIGTHMLLVGKPVRKKPLGRPRCRWVSNIMTDHGKIWGVVWTGLAWPGIRISGRLL
jgi:hypothetical protein